MDKAEQVNWEIHRCWTLSGRSIMFFCFFRFFNKHQCFFLRRLWIYRCKIKSWYCHLVGTVNQRFMLVSCQSLGFINDSDWRLVIQSPFFHFVVCNCKALWLKSLTHYNKWMGQYLSRHRTGAYNCIRCGSVYVIMCITGNKETGLESES